MRRRLGIILNVPSLYGTGISGNRGWPNGQVQHTATRSEAVAASQAAPLTIHGNGSTTGAIMAVNPTGRQCRGETGNTPNVPAAANPPANTQAPQAHGPVSAYHGVFRGGAGGKEWAASTRGYESRAKAAAPAANGGHGGGFGALHQDRGGQPQSKSQPQGNSQPQDKSSGHDTKAAAGHGGGGGKDHQH